MAIDDVILVAGDFGRYQRRIYFLLCLPLFTCGFHTMVGVFLAAKPDFRCLLPHENAENATYQLSPSLTNASFPWDLESEDWSECERYDVNLTDQVSDLDGNFSFTTSTVKCEAFVYDKTTYQLTTTTEFNLVCDSSWLRATADSLFMVGVMLGAMIFGGLSDRYGRKPIYCLALILQVIIGFLVALSPEIISYMIFRMLLASTTNGTFLITYITVIEMVVPKKRLMAAIGVEIVFTSGYILTAAFAYFITNWRFLQIAINIPNLAFLVYWWLIPESARWLVTTGRLEEAKDCLQKASSGNGIELSRDKLDAMLDSCSVSKPDLEKTSFFDLMRYPNLRRKSFLLFFSWFVNNSTYYGLSWNTSNLIGDDYVNFAIAGLVEIPAHLLVFFTLNRRGRKSILCSTLLLAGISLLLTIFVPDDVSWLKVALTMIGKLAITASFTSLYVFTAEQYPTVIRSIGVGACSTCARIGGILSPYINYSSTLWSPLPVVMFGSGSLIAGLSAFLLPETLGQKLLESIEDGEQFGKKSKKLEKSSTAGVA